MAKHYQEPTADEVRRRFSYDPDTGILTYTKAPKYIRRVLHGKEAGRRNHQGYREVVMNNKQYQEHRIIWLYVYGAMPDGHIDHINRCRDDNRIANLRVVTRSQNKHNGNTYSNNTSGEPGVSFNQRCNRWYAQINIGGTRRRLGSFVNFEDAVLVRHRAKAALDAVLFAINPTDNKETTP